jgi:hypothetical protein
MKSSISSPSGKVSNQRRYLFNIIVLSVCLSAGWSWGQGNILTNPGFENGVPNSGWGTNVAYWLSPSTAHGNLIDDALQAHSGNRAARDNAFGPGSKILTQYWPANQGQVYEADGWMRTDVGANAFRPSNGFAMISMQFYDVEGIKIAANVETLHFGPNGPTNWTHFGTGPALAPAGTVTGRTLCVYQGMGDVTTNGYVWFDDLRTSNSSPTQAGALRNPDFEVQPVGDINHIPYWTGFGFDGGVTNNARRGRFALRIYWPETLLGQTWSATSGVRYMTEGYMMTPSENPMSSTSVVAMVMLQFLNATNGVLATYEGGKLTRNSTPDDWILSHAEGIAPPGTVYGRTMCAVVGNDPAYSGFVYFDDFNQALVSSSATVCGVISNPGFDDGLTGNAYELDQLGLIPGWHWAGGTNAGYIQQSYKFEGPQSLAITYPNNLMAQSTAAVTGRTYVYEGYIYNPASERMTGAAYGTLLLEFLKGTDLVSVIEGPHFTASSPADTWTKFSITNRAPWSGAAVTARVSAAILGDPTGYGGALYFDSFCVNGTNIAVAPNTQAGALWNPGFEYTSKGTVLKHVDNWTALGAAGNVDNAYARTGENALKFYASETLAAQSWPAVGGYTYGCSTYAFTPSAARFSGHSNVQAILVMEFLNVTNGVVMSYASSPFKINAAANVWSNLSVSGVAPMDAVSARTLIGIVGPGTNFAGAVYFDDVSQSVLATGSTHCGVIANPGFDDGIPGNAYLLDQAGNLPAWKWLGGTNAGFVQNTYKLDGQNAMAITFPQNLAAQDFAATTSMSYIVSGYIYNPSTERLAGNCRGSLLLSFFVGTNQVSTKESAIFTTNTPANTWVYFSVTNRAPSSGAVTGRVSAAFLGDTTGVGGALYFDSICVTATNIPYTPSQNGAILNPGFEDTAEGSMMIFIDHWKALGLSGVVDSSVAHSGANSLNIYFPGTLVQQDWAAQAGAKYSCSGFVYTASSAKLTGTNAQAVLVMQFLNATNGVLISYASDLFTSTNAADVWTQLSAIGVAPQGTVTGRTLVGLVGTTNGGFSGSVYFDDIGQRTIWTTAPVYSLLRNAGFDDNPPGNAYDLGVTGDLPAWSWLGGTNAGYIARNVKLNEEQSLAITYPNNLMAQKFVVSTNSGNLLLNAGFEIGPAGGAEAPNWGRYGNGGQENWAAETGTNGYVFPGWVNGGFGGIYQGVSVSMAQGNVFTFSIDGNVEANFTSSANETWMKLEFWVNGESNPRYSLTNDIYSALKANSGTWRTYTMTVTNGVSGINEVRALVGYGNAQDVGGSQAARFDNAVLTQSTGNNYGKSYVLEGYIYNPSTEKFAGSAYGTYLLQFYNNATDLVSVVDAGKFLASSPTNTWVKFSVTNRAPWSGTIDGQVSAAILGDPTGAGGALYFDGLSLRMTNIYVAPNIQGGAIWNGGFEYTAKGTVLKYVDNWSALGSDGNVDDAYARSGEHSLKFSFTETLAAQTWPVVGGYTYRCSGFAFTPSANRFSGNSNLQAVLVMEFLNETNGVVISYASNPFKTNAAPNTWVNLIASGVAPLNAVNARTLVGIVGPTNNFAGAVYFDEVTSALLATGATHCGFIDNPGFDDGIPGNAYLLEQAHILPAWKWLGGTNAGFVQNSVVYEGLNALSITYPQNVAAQDFAATTGMSYIVSGYIYNPSTERLVGNCHGSLLLSFFNGTNPVSTKESRMFTTNTPANTWVYFSVTNRAPMSGSITGRVMAAFLGDTVGVGGALYFDSLCVTATNIPYTPTQDGAIHNPGFEDSSAGTGLGAIDSWTGLGSAGAVDSTYAHRGENSLKIYFPGTLVQQDWTAEAGAKYACSGFVYTASSDRLTGTNAQAVLVMQFLNSTNGVLISYASDLFTSTNAADAWTQLSAIGVAPQGTVSGRTLVGLIGTTNGGFSGSVYFDDIGQRTVWTRAPIYSMLINAGFDDNPPGNVSELALTGDLPAWTWLGGTNAGYIARSVKFNEEQSLAITYPNNLMVQNFAVSSSSGNLLLNPGFEIGPADGAEAPNWSRYGEGGQQNWAAETGTNGYVLPGWVNGGYGGIVQSVAVNLSQGNVFTYSIDGNVEADFTSSANETWMKIEFWVNGESTPRAVVTNDIYSALKANTGTWRTYTMTATNSVSGINEVRVLLGYGNAQNVGGSQAARFDNASLVQSSDQNNNGKSYILEGRIYNPGTEKFTGSAYGAYLLQFYNNATDLVSVVDAGKFLASSPTNTWVYFSVTNRAPWTGSINGQVAAAVLGDTTGAGGALYFDGLSLRMTNIVVATNTVAGGIWNPGFEYTAKGTVLKYVDNWTALGVAANVDNAYARMGQNSLKFYASETLAGQTWNATPGHRYATMGYAFTPSTDRFSGHSNLQAMVILQFLNSTNGVLFTYSSPAFKTNATPNTWSNLMAAGVAPAGTVYARTLIGIVGPSSNYSGVVHFDDVSVSLLSTGGTVSGLLHNPGFDDGVPGDAYHLSAAGDMPYWSWLGGTNAGFVQADTWLTIPHSLGIMYPNNLAVQGFTAETGMTYVLRGNIYNPSSQRLQGSAYGAFLLEFYQGSNLVSVKDSFHFTTNSPVDTWVPFIVTNRAPISGNITGRVGVAILGNTAGFGGALYFDALRLTATNIPFTPTQDGAIHNPGFEDSSAGTGLGYIDNWTGLGSAGAVDSTYAHRGGNSLKIYFPGTLVQQDWTAEAGAKYACSGFVYTASSDKLTGTNAQAVLVMQFLNSTNGVLISYASDLFTSTNAADAWSQLSAIGVAPQGTVSGRTLVGLIGTTNGGFSGSVYFDDIGQRTVWTRAPIYSMLINAGFDDNPPGNVSELALTGDLPAWTWLGGTNAGYIARSVKFNEEQSLAITYPNNLMAQNFAVSAASANLLLNPGFEIGPASGAEAPNWWRYGNGGQENWAAETGTNGYVLPGWVSGGYGGIVQDASVNLAQGNVFTFAIDGNAEADFTSSSGETWMKLEFWVNGESIPRTAVTNNIYAGLKANPGAWRTYSMTVTNTISEVNQVKVLIGYGNAQDVGGSQAARFDNASLVQSSDQNNNGKSYILEGRIYNPGTEKFTGSAYGAYLLQFYNNATDLVSVVDAGKFLASSPTNTWVYFSVTNRAPWTGSINGQVAAAVLGDATGAGGALYFDGLSLRMTNITVAPNTQSGALWNPGFEYTAKGTVLKYIDNWTAMGFDGSVDGSYARTGQNSLKFVYTETLAAQSWPAVGGYTYGCSAYASTPSTARFGGHSNVQAVLVMEFLNSTNGVLMSYASSPFKTNATPNTWSNLSVNGVAPMGAVSARTLIGIVGPGTNFAGAVHFDDVSQSLLATGATRCGEIANPGFDDGITGNAYLLEQSGDLPAWKWLGGTNAGFVQNSVRLGGVNALSITYPQNVAAQDFAATTGMTYIVSGYIYNPSTERLAGNCYGSLLLSFFNGTNQVSVKESLRFTTNSPANTWMPFAVVSRAPLSGSITGRVQAAFLGDTTGAGGALYFDSLCVVATNIPYTPTQDGAIHNPGFEDSSAGTGLGYIDNWTGLGDAGVVDSTYSRHGANSLKIYFPGTLVQQDWTAVAGAKYSSSGFVYTASSDRLTGTNAQAVLVMQFLNSTNGVLISYASDLFTSTNAADAWTQLSAIGVAPQGTVSGRTLVGLIGTTNGGFSGSVYFDDIGQRTVWTVAPVYSLLRNAGFDDNIPGNLYDMDATGELPAWNWVGGTNAGYIARSFKYNEEQSAAITFPNNLIQQDFPVSTSGGNMLLNPGFENGSASGSEPQNWTRYGEGGQQSWGAETGTNGYVFPGWINGSFGGIVQEVPVSLYMGNIFTFTVDANAEEFFTSSTGEAWMKMEFWVNGESTPRATMTNSIYAGLKANPNRWIQYAMTVTNTIPQVNRIKVLVGYGNAQNVGGSQAAKIDNASLIQTTGENNNGMCYVLEGRIYNPATEKFAGSAYGAYLLEFYNNGTDLVSVVDAGKFLASSPTNTWVYFSVTNRAPRTGAILGRASASILGSASNYGGALYFDGLRLSMTNIPQTNTQSGALWNPGFEYTSKGTVLKYIDNWSAMGNAGGIDDAYALSGTKSLKIYYPETLLGQTWAATPGYRYGSSGYAFTPLADRLSGNSSLQALVILQYLNGTGGVIQSYASASFTTNNPAGVWTNLSVTGVAPAGSVYGRTLIGLLGSGSNFSGSVHFDDISQSLVATGTTSSGLLINAGFDDGAPGNCQLLQRNNELPGWTWNGGANAGFIIRDYYRNPDQSLVLTYPMNPLSQNFTASSGKVYKLEGYMFTPASDKFTTDGSSYGQMSMEFMVNGSTNVAPQYTRNSGKFGASQPANTWVYFSVIATSPASAVVTGRVTCTIHSTDLWGDFDLGGVILFDQLTLNEVTNTVPPSAPRGSAGVGMMNKALDPNGDADGDGISNADEAIAGTLATDAESYLRITSQTMLPNGSIRITWDSEADRSYTVSRSDDILGSSFTVLRTGIPATPPENVYIDLPPEGVAGFYRVSVKNPLAE